MPFSLYFLTVYKVHYSLKFRKSKYTDNQIISFAYEYLDYIQYVASI